MALQLELKSYGDVDILVHALSMAVQARILSQEQAQGALKDQLYDCGILKRPVVQEKVVEKKKQVIVDWEGGDYMSLCRILIHYPNSENWSVGDVVEITNPDSLIAEGKVELYQPPQPIVEETFPTVVKQKK